MAPVAKDAAVERSSDDHGDAPLGAERQKGVAGSAVEQGPAPRKQHQVDRCNPCNRERRLAFVQPDADSADLPGCLEVEQRRQGVVHDLAEACRLVFAVRPAIGIVHQDDVDAVEPEPSEARVERAANTVPAVVERNLEGWNTDEPVPVVVLADGWLEQPADLAGQDIVAARLASEKPAEPALAQTVTVERGGVEVADTSLPGAVERGMCLIVGDGPAQIADRPAAEAEAGGGNAGPSERARGEGRCHERLLPGRCRADKSKPAAQGRGHGTVR